MSMRFDVIRAIQRPNLFFRILDDDDDDETPAEQSTSNGQKPVNTAIPKMNLPIRLLHRIQQLQSENVKAQREVNVMKRKYMELKKRCETMNGTLWLEFIFQIFFFSSDLPLEDLVL